MKSLIVIFLLSTVISCSKETSNTTTPATDARNNVVGVYQGTITYQGVHIYQSGLVTLTITKATSPDSVICSYSGTKVITNGQVQYVDGITFTASFKKGGTDNATLSDTYKGGYLNMSETGTFSNETSNTSGVLRLTVSGVINSGLSYISTFYVKN